MSMWFNDKRLVEAVKLIQEHCIQDDCRSCILKNCYGDCMFTCDQYVYTSEHAPRNWDIPVIR